MKKKIFEPKLIVVDGKDKGKVFPLKSGTLVFGRKKGDYLLNDIRISRTHIAVTVDESHKSVSFTDLKSLNGTQVNGETSLGGELSDGDKVQIGNTVLECQLHAHASTKEEREAASEISQPSMIPVGDAIESVSQRIEPVSHSKSSMKRSEIASGKKVQASGSRSHSAKKHERGSEDLGGKSRRSIARHAMEMDPDIREVLMTREKKSSFLGLASEKISARLRTRTQKIVAILLLVLCSLVLSKLFSSHPTLDSELAQVEALVKSHQTDQAISKMVSLESQFEQNPTYYLNLGILYRKDHQLEKALDALQKCHGMPSPPPTVHVELARTLLLSNFKAKASEEMGDVEKNLDSILRTDKASVIGKQEIEFLTAAARLLIDNKQLMLLESRATISQLSEALQKKYLPRDVVGYELEARYFLDHNELKEADRVLTGAYQSFPTNEWVLENLSYVKLTAKDIPATRQVLEAWTQAYPQSTTPLLVMGYLAFNEKDFPEAITYLQKITEMGAKQPQSTRHYAEALDLMGQIYYQQNQLKEATGVFEQACQLGHTASCQHPLLKNQETSPTQPPTSGTDPASGMAPSGESSP